MKILFELTVLLVFALGLCSMSVLFLDRCLERGPTTKGLALFASLARGFATHLSASAFPPSSEGRMFQRVPLLMIIEEGV